MRGAQAERRPRREREAEETHDLGAHAALLHLLVRYAHLVERVVIPLHAVQLTDVREHVGERVHGEHGHLGEVGEAQPASVDPLGLVVLQHVQTLRRALVIVAQLPPGEVARLHVGPREHGVRLVPPAEDGDGDSRRDVHLPAALAIKYCAGRPRRLRWTRVVLGASRANKYLFRKINDCSVWMAPILAKLVPLNSWY